MCVCVACTYNWTLTPHTNVFDGRQNAAASLEACQQACIDDADCTGVDWNANEPAGSQCWHAGPWSQPPNICGAPGIDHYDLIRVCPPPPRTLIHVLSRGSVLKQNYFEEFQCCTRNHI